MTTLLKEYVQAKINETRWMVGGTNHGKMAVATENRAQEAGDVPVQDLRFTGGRGMVTRQARHGPGAGES